MIDLETLSTSPAAAIISAAAVPFLLHEGLTGGGGHWLLDGNDGERDDETLAWAEKNGTWPHAEGAALISEKALLLVLREVVCKWGGEWAPTIWIWGADFDSPILKSAAVRQNMRMPWQYWHVSCARTAWKLAFGNQPRPKRDHNPLRDCYAAIQDLRLAVQKLGGLRA